MNNAFWRGKKVFLTGHTGFKGTWLSFWLSLMGAKVTGYALQPPTHPNLFSLCKVDSRIKSLLGDICDYYLAMKCIKETQPDIVFHLAAQPLVNESYRSPVSTFATNVMGTVNVLEAVRQCSSVRAVVVVTTDKCYENKEWVWGYRETDTLGGHDPYSSSKACAELVTGSYIKSFFCEDTERIVGVATARAGNVIGGGDWASERLVPDLIRSLTKRQPMAVRSPYAIRPWQHVLEPLLGYIMLAEKLCCEEQAFVGSWNFGPDESHAWTVEKLTNAICQLWGEPAMWQNAGNSNLHETKWLHLDSTRAKRLLKWKPILTIEETLEMTVDWYKRWSNGEDAQKLMLEQIEDYQHKILSRVGAIE